MSKDQRNGHGNGNGYPVEIWQKVENEYSLGQLSVSAISRAYGPSRQAIMKHMDILGITRHLASDVKNSVAHKLVEAELQHPVTPENYDEAIESYGERGAGVVGAHKVLFSKILQQVDVTCNDLDHSQGIMKKLATGDRVKKNIVMAAQLALKERNNLMRTVAYVVDKIVPLQRQAIGLDGEGSGVEKITYYIIGDLEKPIDAGMGRLKSA
jgi:hypothetical protein